MPKTYPELISTAEAASYLDVSINTIRNYVKAGKLAPHRVGPKPLFKFDPADLDKVSPKVEDESPRT